MTEMTKCFRKSWNYSLTSNFILSKIPAFCNVKEALTQRSKYFDDRCDDPLQ